MNGDGGDFLIWISLIAVLFIVNYLAITSYNKKKTSFFWSGLLICILGPVIGFITGSIFVSMDHGAGGTGEGGAIGGAFIGLIILGNGIIYVMVGAILAVSNFFKK